MSPVGSLPGGPECPQPEIGHSPRQAPAHRPQSNGYPTRPGERGETTNVTVPDFFRHLGINRSHPLEEGGGGLGPEVVVVTMDHDQPLGDDTGLPGGLGRNPTPGVHHHHRGDPGGAGEESEAEPGETGTGNTDQLGDTARLELQVAFFPSAHLEKRSGEVEAFDAQSDSDSSDDQ